MIATAAVIAAAAVAVPAVFDHPLTVRVTAPPTQARSGQTGFPALLSRPFTLPDLRPGQSCPTTTGSEVNNAVFGGVAYGHGPVRLLVGNRTAPGIGRVDLGLTGTPGLLAVETVWYATPGYDGPFVVRGRNLTTGTPIPSGTNDLTPGPLEIPAGPTANTVHGYRTVPGATWITAPGCYSWQVDAPGFTSTIVLDLLAGQLHGQIKAAGGPTGTTSTALPGTVRIWRGPQQGPPTLSFPVQAGHSFTVALPPGTYAVTATSPDYNNGKNACAPPAAVTIDNTGKVNVTLTCNRR